MIRTCFIVVMPFCLRFPHNADAHGLSPAEVNQLIQILSVKSFICV